MKKADFEKAIYEVCKPIAVDMVAGKGLDPKQIFSHGDFTEYAPEYGYFTIFKQNLIGWSDRIVFEVHYNKSHTKIWIENCHYFEA